LHDRASPIYRCDSDCSLRRRDHGAVRVRDNALECAEAAAGGRKAKGLTLSGHPVRRSFDRRKLLCASTHSSAHASAGSVRQLRQGSNHRTRTKVCATGEHMVPLSWYLGLSALLFTIGAVGVFVKRNAITIFLCIELMLNAVNLSFVSLSGFFGDVGGQLFVFIVMTVAAAEAAVGLAIIISIFRNRESLNVDEVDSLKL